MVYKLEASETFISTSVMQFDNEDAGCIPEALAVLTMTILGLHKANGDLAWVEDMIGEIGGNEVKRKSLA